MRYAKHIAALDAGVSVRSSHGLAKVLDRCLIDLAAPDAAPPPSHVLELRHRLTGWDVSVDGRSRARRVDASDALYGALGWLGDLASSSVVSHATLLHGGAVEFAEGTAAFVGPSGAGKSTLTAASLRAGGALVAEEVVAIDPGGRVQPFHRPVGLRAGGLEEIGVAHSPGPFRHARPVAASSLGSLSAGGPLDLILILDRHDGGEASITLMSPAEALSRLTNESLGPAGHERKMFRRLEHLVRHIPVGLLRFRRAIDGVAQVRSRLRSMGRPPG